MKYDDGDEVYDDKKTFFGYFSIEFLRDEDARRKKIATIIKCNRGMKLVIFHPELGIIVEFGQGKLLDYVSIDSKPSDRYFE